MNDQCAAGPKIVARIGRYTLGYSEASPHRRWEASNGCIGRSNARTRTGAIVGLMILIHDRKKHPVQPS